MRIILTIALLLMTSACTTMKYGSLLGIESPDHSMVVVDAMQKMTEYYLPAKSSLVLGQEVKKKDVFGHDLLSAIRKNGYSIQEYMIDSEQQSGIEFKYRLDKVEDLVYLTLHFDDTALSRAYGNVDGKLMPNGSWSRMEHEQ